MDLRNSKLDRCNFTAASLQDCCFDGSSLRECNFNRADLYNARLRGCDLTKASFKQANLFYADLSGSDLTGAITALAQIGYTVLKDAKVDGSIAIPEEVRDAAEKLHAAGFAVVPGGKDGVQGLGDYALDADGVTVTTNYYGGQRDEKV